MLKFIFVAITMVTAITLVACSDEDQARQAERSDRTSPATRTPSAATTETAVDDDVPTNSGDLEWDVVVLGRVDACFVCQHGPSPHVSYTRVLAGDVPGDQAQGELAVVEVAEHLLPEGGTPIYKSEREEITLLTKVVVPGYEDTDAYKVLDVMEVTPENLAKFQGQ